MDDTLTGGNVPHYTPTAGRPQLGQHNVVMRVLQALGGRHPNDNLLLALNALRPGTGGAIMPPAARAPLVPLPTPRPNPPSSVGELVQSHFNSRNPIQSTPPQSTPENVTGLMERLGFRNTNISQASTGSSYHNFTDLQSHLPLQVSRNLGEMGGVPNPPYRFRFSTHTAAPRHQGLTRKPPGSRGAVARGRTYDVNPRSRFSNFNELEQHLYSRLDPKNPNIQSRASESTQLTPEQLSFLEALLGK